MPWFPITVFVTSGKHSNKTHNKKHGIFYLGRQVLFGMNVGFSRVVQRILAMYII